MTTVTVNAVALRRVLVALSGPSYLIRELQAINSPSVPDNPIGILIKEYNDSLKEQDKKED